jgi:hypothetical protein
MTRRSSDIASKRAFMYEVGLEHVCEFCDPKIDDYAQGQTEAPP